MILQFVDGLRGDLHVTFEEGTSAAWLYDLLKPQFYTALLTKGIRPEMARLTLARKIATIVLMVWKRGACFELS
jgi:hypothetical protein